jgi:hypothetical protein
MKVAMVSLAALGGVQCERSPVGKVISMISELQAKVIKEGEVVQKEYEEFAEWCEDRNRDLGFEIKTGNSDVESLKAAIGEEEASIQSLTAKVEQLVADVAKDDADLKAASGIREKEAADFAAVNKELSEQIGMLERAIGILEKEMKGGASMMQLQSAGSVAQALNVMVQASLIGTADASKLTALVQDSHRAKDEDDDEAPGAPAAAVYESKSGGIIDTMEDLLSKAQGELDAARKQETTSRNEFDMLKQSLDDEIKFGDKEKGEAQKGIAESTEKKSKAEGELQVSSKDLSEDVKAKESLHADCMSRASAFESETKSRGEELSALAKAKSIIEEAMSSASASFIQVARSRISSRSDLKSFEAVRYVRDLAHKQKSTALAQLAARMSSALQSGAGDPFAKVKGLIADMIKKLEKAADEDATKKAYCD